MDYSILPSVHKIKTIDELPHAIKSSLKNNLKVFFCIGETIKEKKEKKTKKILIKQIKKGLSKINNLKNIIKK